MSRKIVFGVGLGVAILLAFAMMAGCAGQAGPAGPAGSAGPAGPAGPAGSAGPAGPAGPTGPAGSAGSVGAAGSAGSSSPCMNSNTSWQDSYRAPRAWVSRASAPCRSTTHRTPPRCPGPRPRSGMAIR